ncbi:MAG: HAD family phosphatase [Ruminococcus sp.]|nr:HAD family phosphatase [Ruminococcus sp.]
MNILDFKGAIFDLDGTLVDSAGVWNDIDIRFLSKRGIEIPDDYAKQVSALDFYDAAIYTRERFGLDDEPEAMIDEWFGYALDEYSHNIKALPHAAELLERLKSEGVKIALATASDKRLYTAVLSNNGILGYFDVFASTDEVSRGKGYPDVYELAAQRLGLEAGECIVFEDIIEGIQGAKAGGFTAAACLYGSFSADRDRMCREADISFSDYSQLFCGL